MRFRRPPSQGTQLPCVPAKAPGSGADCLRDWISTINAVTLADLSLALRALEIGPETMYTCIASSGSTNAADAPSADLHGHTMPSLMRR